MQRWSATPLCMACMGQTASHPPHFVHRSSRTSLTPMRLRSAGAKERGCRLVLGMCTSEKFSALSFASRGASNSVGARKPSFNKAVFGGQIRRADDGARKALLRVPKCPPVRHSAVHRDKRRVFCAAIFQKFFRGRRHPFAVDGEDEEQRFFAARALFHGLRVRPQRLSADARNVCAVPAPRKIAHVNHGARAPRASGRIRGVRRGKIRGSCASPPSFLRAIFRTACSQARSPAR